jgi:hypothetical protein
VCLHNVHVMQHAVLVGGLTQCIVLICDSVLARWADILYLGAAAGALDMSQVFGCWDGELSVA